MTQRLAAVTFGIMAVAQIAVPLTDDDRGLTTAVILAFAATTVLLSSHRWGWSRTGASLVTVVAGTLCLEWLGSTTGVPFGDYHYTDALQPQLGGVPMIVPLAWFAMGVPALAVGRRLSGRRVVTVAIGAVALSAWDLFLDPQMVEEGYWVWAADGIYRGIPWTNYAGWLGSSLVVLAVLDRLLPDRGQVVEHVALYTWWAVMNTIGFMVFFGDPLVGVIGGLVMVPLAAAAVVGREPAAEPAWRGEHG